MTLGQLRMGERQMTSAALEGVHGCVFAEPIIQCIELPGGTFDGFQPSLALLTLCTLSMMVCFARNTLKTSGKFSFQTRLIFWLEII